MSKMHLYVGGEVEDIGQPQIVRELSADDNRDVAQYATDLFKEVPKDKAELDALVLMYEGSGLSYMGNSVRISKQGTRPSAYETDSDMWLGAFVNDQVKGILGDLGSARIDDIVRAGDDIHITVDYRHVDCGFTGDEGRVKRSVEYIRFNDSLHQENTRRYKEWQLGRMENPG